MSRPDPASLVDLERYPLTDPDSLHRVNPVVGERCRYVGLMGFDTKPGTDSSDLLKMVRYGRTEPIGS